MVIHAKLKKKKKKKEIHNKNIIIELSAQVKWTTKSSDGTKLWGSEAFFGYFTGFFFLLLAISLVYCKYFPSPKLSNLMFWCNRRSNRFSSVKYIQVKLINEKETNVGRDLVLSTCCWLDVKMWVLLSKMDAGLNEGLQWIKKGAEFKWT